jgi:hypothetical protein
LPVRIEKLFNKPEKGKIEQSENKIQQTIFYGYLPYNKINIVLEVKIELLLQMLDPLPKKNEDYFNINRIIIMKE